MMVIPLKKQFLKNGIKLSEEKTQYGNFPSSVIGQNLLLPQYIYAGKVNFIDKKITYDSYDTNGNIIQFTSENGISTTIIWGYNKTLPIAKIENATNNQVSSYIANLQSLSNTGTETQLIAALNLLRDSLPNAMVTTYTHLPLVGVSTITDPKGDAITYTYDSFNRLKEVKDRNGNKLSENEYHYKP
jgi:YD repeat-containing protein